jgi:hypothetical protein
VRKRIIRIALVVGLVALVGTVAVAGLDFGQKQDAKLRAQSQRLFGVKSALAASSTTSADPAEAAADARKLATFASGLHVHVVTQGVAAPILDMITLWPNDTNPTHLIACNEGDETEPGLQRIDLATGEVATILTGTISCDPTHSTPWGTLVFGEENGGGPTGGRMYELLDPLAATDVTLDRATGTFSGGVGTKDFTALPALGRNSFEGFGILPNGVAYFGDENRPNVGTAGGAYFKFIPSVLWTEGDPPITDLARSPFASGSIYGLRVGLRSGATDYGQGTEIGLGVWVPIPASPDPDLRAEAAALHLTGYYRPEDLQLDLGELANGNVRWCGNNTGNQVTDHTWGNTTCLTDGTVEEAAANTATPDIQLFIVGDAQFSMMDNVAFQSGRGNWIIHEDGDNVATGRNNDLWDCLPDGGDDDTLSDGCIRIATLNDLGPAGTASEGEGAEWTGGVFDSTGTRFFVSVQHNMTGFGVIYEVTGWS